jgi:hypothetical protein
LIGLDVPEIGEKTGEGGHYVDDDETVGCIPLPPLNRHPIRAIIEEVHFIFIL